MPLLIFYTTAFPKSDTDINSMSPYQPRKNFIVTLIIMY